MDNENASREIKIPKVQNENSDSQISKLSPELQEEHARLKTESEEAKRKLLEFEEKHLGIKTVWPEEEEK